LYVLFSVLAPLYRLLNVKPGAVPRPKEWGYSHIWLRGVLELASLGVFGMKTSLFLAIKESVRVTLKKKKTPSCLFLTSILKGSNKV